MNENAYLNLASIKLVVHFPAYYSCVFLFCNLTTDHCYNSSPLLSIKYSWYLGLQKSCYIKDSSIQLFIYERYSFPYYNSPKLAWFLAGVGYPEPSIFLLTMQAMLPSYSYLRKATSTPPHVSLWEVKKEVKNKLSYTEEYKPSQCVQECGFKTFTHIPLAGICLHGNT